MLMPVSLPTASIQLSKTLDSSDGVRDGYGVNSVTISYDELHKP